MLNTKAIRKQLKNAWEEDAYYLRTATSWISGVCGKINGFTVRISALCFALVLSAYVLYPTVANADMEHEQILLDTQTVEMIIEQMKNATRPYGRLKMAEDAPARRTFTIPITAYTSEVGQTDDTPCVTASGLDVCERDEENIVAANFLPLGTRVRIPELYGDRVFYVEDRMNERYYHKMDIWMKQKVNAKQFGVKYATIEVF